MAAVPKVAHPFDVKDAVLTSCRLSSDAGTPYGFRHMDAWSGHAYRLVNNDGNWVYVRVHLSTDQGILDFTGAESDSKAEFHDAWATRKLYDAIDAGAYPSWTVGIAIMLEQEAADYRYDVLDVTKDWLGIEYHEIDRILLTLRPNEIPCRNRVSKFLSRSYSPSLGTFR